MQEAMKRAMSGGRRNSLKKFMRQIERPDFADSPDKKGKNSEEIDYSNSYIAERRGKSTENTNEMKLFSYAKAVAKPSEEESTTMQPAFIKQSSVQPCQQVYLYGDEKNGQMASTVDDGCSVETKSQLTDNMLTSRTKKKKKQLVETLDAAMAQKVMIYRQQKQNEDQNPSGTSS